MGPLRERLGPRREVGFYLFEGLSGLGRSVIFVRQVGMCGDQCVKGEHGARGVEDVLYSGDARRRPPNKLPFLLLRGAYLSRRGAEDRV